MSKKKILLLVTTICVALTLIIALNMLNASPQTQDNSQPTTPITSATTPDETVFVVPENPVGTVGIVTAIAAAFTLFTAIKKRK